MSDSNSISLEKLKSLIGINARINSNIGDADALLLSILQSAISVVECEAASLLLVNKATNSLYFSIALGPKGAEVKKIPVSLDSIAGWVYLHKKSQIINDCKSDFRFNDTVQSKTNYTSRNMIAFPMIVNKECVGVIELINKAGNRDFDDVDLDMVELLGEQAGIAYVNASEFINAKEKYSTLQNVVNAGKDYHPFVAKSSVIMDLMSVIDQVAKTNSSVLIIGESGVGKELFAEQIHLKSERSQKPFIRVSCAALSPSLLESELFGHVKGAFTDAVSNQKGRFELADGGTLFLDEIGELPLNLQSKLLRAIQERKFERVGSGETVSVDVRIVAATNRDLEEMVKNGSFRSDLYYRLNVMPLNIPPLRQRKDDIEVLANFFLEYYCNEIKKSFSGFSVAALNAMYNYYWPGNIRELQNTVERACILCTGNRIEVKDLGLMIDASKEDKGSDVTDNITQELLNGEDKSLKNALTSFKREYVKKILESTNWNQTEAAKILDVQRTYVSKLINELGISALRK